MGAVQPDKAAPFELIKLVQKDFFADLNIPAASRSNGQQRRASSSCLTIREFRK
jgi:hypothetical protein